MTVVFHADGVLTQFEGYEQLREFDWEGYRAGTATSSGSTALLEAEGDSTNRYKVSKQADVLMLLFLLSRDELRGLLANLGYDVSAEQLARTVDYYLAADLARVHAQRRCQRLGACPLPTLTRPGGSYSGRWRATSPTFRAEPPQRASTSGRWPAR